MTVSRVAGAKPPPSAHADPVQVALNAMGKITDALIAKLDKNKDGQLNEAELTPLLNQLTTTTDQIAISVQSAASVDRSGVLAGTRAKIKDADRALLTVASAIAKIPGKDRDTVSVGELQKATRQTHREWVALVQNKNSDDLQNALGKMFAAVLLPDALFNAARSAKQH